MKTFAERAAEIEKFLLNYYNETDLCLLGMDIRESNGKLVVSAGRGGPWIRERRIGRGIDMRRIVNARAKRHGGDFLREYTPVGKEC